MDTLTRAQAVFTRQIDAYVDAGYDDLADLTESEFRDAVEPLRTALDRAVAEGLTVDASPDQVPFAVVVTGRILPPSVRAHALRVSGGDKPGAIDPGHVADVNGYSPASGIEIPDADSYLLLDVRRGDTFREIAADDAVRSLVRDGRTPLTLDEGISYATVHPAALEVDAGFLLAGSRSGKRVPALWVTAGAAMLGWGGESTPETWLGVASAARRVVP
jgi:hypothetical protein